VSEAFGGLVQRLSQALQQLAEAIARERSEEAQALVVLEEKLKSSLQTAAIAHEINLPLSTLLRNVQTDHQNLNLAQVARSALLYASPSLKAGQITVEG
jgi:hypothetical protein